MCKCHPRPTFFVTTILYTFSYIYDSPVFVFFTYLFLTAFLLSLAWSFGVTADNLDTVGVNLVRVVELEVDILDNEGPDVVTEAVGIKMSLSMVHQHERFGRFLDPTHLKGQTALDFVCEHVCDRLIEVDQDLHSELGLDTSLGD